MKSVKWKLERCPNCKSFAVQSLDNFWGCRKCRDLSYSGVSKYPEGCCVYCGKPLIILMDACLDCGNQPRK